MIYVRVLPSTVAGDTLFVDIMDLYGECLVYTKDHPKLKPLICLQENVCTVGNRCMERLHKRVGALFQAFPNCDQIICKFGKEGMTDPDDPSYRKLQRQGAAVFTRDGDARRFDLNSYAYVNTVQRQGDLYSVDESQLDWDLGGDSPAILDPSLNPAQNNTNET